MKNPFLSYIHNFRGLAIILIVGVHCRTSLEWREDSLVHAILIAVLDSSTILFVFITGFLFQHLNATGFSYYGYISKKVNYVAIPYLLVSIPAILARLLFETKVYWMDSFYTNLYPPFQILYMLLTGKHSGPFYFIPMIFLIFISAPVLFRLQKTSYFTLIMAGIVTLGLFTYTYGYYASIAESFLYFVPVYLFGMWVSRNKDFILNMNSVVLCSLIVGYGAIFYLEITKQIMIERLHFFEITPHYFTTTFNWSKLKEMILAVILLTAFYRFRKKNFKYLTLLGSFSFGIYFIHIYFISGIGYLFRTFQLSNAQNGLGFLVLIAVIITLSTITVYLIKKIFKEKSRFFIGS